MANNETYNPCDDCQYSFSKNNQESNICKICEFRQLLDKPTADVVEVVHCRDCKHLYELSAIDRRFYCRHHPQGLTGINIIEDNPYCSYGERRVKNESERLSKPVEETR